MIGYLARSSHAVGPMHRAHAWACGLLAVVLTGVAPTGAAVEQSPAAAEYEVKAAYVFNFASFVTWPPASFGSTTAPIVIGIAGASPIDEPLTRAVRGESVNGRPLEVRRVTTASEIASCNVLFLGSAETLPRAIGQSASILTIGESNNFLQAGGMIRLVVSEDKKVGFEVNVGATSAAGLQLNARLLKVARRVVGAAAAEAPR